MAISRSNNANQVSIYMEASKADDREHRFTGGSCAAHGHVRERILSNFHKKWVRQSLAPPSGDLDKWIFFQLLIFTFFILTHDLASHCVWNIIHGRRHASGCLLNDLFASSHLGRVAARHGLRGTRRKVRARYYTGCKANQDQQV